MSNQRKSAIEQFHADFDQRIDEVTESLKKNKIVSSVAYESGLLMPERVEQTIYAFQELQSLKDAVRYGYGIVDGSRGALFEEGALFSERGLFFGKRPHQALEETPKIDLLGESPGVEPYKDSPEIAPYAVNPGKCHGQQKAPSAHRYRAENCSSPEIHQLTSNMLGYFVRVARRLELDDPQAADKLRGLVDDWFAGNRLANVLADISERSQAGDIFPGMGSAARMVRSAAAIVAPTRRK